MNNPFVSDVASPDDVQRKRQLAQLLMQQSMGPAQGQQVGGVYVGPSWTQGLARLLQAHTSQKLQDKATEEDRQIQQQGVQDVGRFVEALRGKSAQPTGQTFETGGNEMGDAPATQMQYSPAQAADPNQALQIALASKSPLLQQAGSSLLSANIAQMMPKQEEWGTEPRYDQQGRAYLVSKQGGIRYLPDVKARDKVEFVNGQAVNPYQTTPGTSIAPQANPYENLAVPGPNGSIVPNTPVIEARKEIQKATPGTNVKIENQLGGSLATQVGPMIAQSHTAALGAQSAIVNADNIIRALDSGKVDTGPGATIRLRGAQVADMLGIGGKDTAEKITKTREVIQGLAQSTLAARKQLAGQGQVSDNEGKLLERAASGNIDDMTTGEIRTVVGVNKRLAQRQIQIHNQLIQKAKQDPATAQISQFFELPPQEQQAPPKVLRFDAQGNPIP